MENNTSDKYYEYYQSKLKEITYKSINLVKYEIIDGMVIKILLMKV